MALSIRIIPCLDVTDGRVVKGVNFTDLVDAGDPVEMANLYNLECADELTFLDISASSSDRVYPTNCRRWYPECGRCRSTTACRCR